MIKTSAAEATTIGIGGVERWLQQRPVEKKLLKLYPSARYLYIVSRPSWPSNVLKFGITKQLKPRFNQYNAGAPDDIEVRHLWVCKEGRRVENLVKERVKPWIVKNRREFVAGLSEAQLVEIMTGFMCFDRSLSRACEWPVYSAATLGPQSPLLSVSSPSSMTLPSSTTTSMMMMMTTLTAPQPTLLGLPPNIGAHSSLTTSRYVNEEEGAAAQVCNHDSAGDDETDETAETSSSSVVIINEREREWLESYPMDALPLPPPPSSTRRLLVPDNGNVLPETGKKRCRPPALPLPPLPEKKNK